jgi:hypothetical protein
MRPLLHRLRPLAFICTLALPAVAHALDLDFELVNKTGYAIKEIYISPAAVDSWQEDVLAAPMGDGESCTINFNSEADAETWDMKIVWVDEGEDVVWKNLNLTKISKLTLHYNADNDTTTAEVE